MPHSFLAEMKNSAQPFGLQNNRQYKLTVINWYSFWKTDDFEKSYLYITTTTLMVPISKEFIFSLHLKMKSLNS